MKLRYSTKSFDDLSKKELYEIMVLRQEVFIVEQDCPYLDADGKDQASYHVMGKDDNGTLQTYTRLVPNEISYDGYTSIGRVVNSLAIRGKGMGKELMEISISEILRLWPSFPIKISAQCYLIEFYQKQGFKITGKEYLEDDIPHIAMIYTLD